MKRCSQNIFSIVILAFAITLMIGCGGNNNSTTTYSNNQEANGSSKDQKRVANQKSLEVIDQKRQKIKLGHSINTTANEYLPIMNGDGSKLYFSAMDRTGFFDFKLDFTKQKSAGGEDIYYSTLKEGVWTDARPITAINTNGHEVVSQISEKGDLVVTANYPEKLGVKDTKDAGVQTTDLFFLKNRHSTFQINHFPEPVNSIFTEADGWMDSEESFLLFVSDRPGHMGDYHKKGWKWNESFWGNTDVYVSLKVDDSWNVPVNLGPVVNSVGAERTPWLSYDGLTLFVSSNGHEKGKNDLNVYAFKRKDINNWTDWDGPYVIKDANTIYDDWGYKEINNGDAFLASATPLGFKPTQGGASGDGGIRETNYRPGYELHGLQVASLNSEFETNIYALKKQNTPAFVVNDVFFDFDSYLIKKSFEKYLDLITDQINQNKKSIVVIIGHTDNLGKKIYNNQLSFKRADEIKKFLISNGIKNTIEIKGLSDANPIAPNNNDENRRKNRRVEIYLKAIDATN